MSEEHNEFLGVKLEFFIGDSDVFNGEGAVEGSQEVCQFQQVFRLYLLQVDPVFELIEYFKDQVDVVCLEEGLFGEASGVAAHGAREEIKLLE